MKSLIKKLEDLHQNDVVKKFNSWSVDEQKDFVQSVKVKDIEEVFDALSDDNDIDIDIDIDIEKIEPLNVLTIDMLEKNCDTYRNAGELVIKKGKLAALLLAGGQGSRLGVSYSKGMVDIGVNRSLYIFECIINNIKKNLLAVGGIVPLYIMTSNANHDEIVEFLHLHNYFGYNKDYVYIFKQQDLPIIDFDHNLVLNSDHKFVMTPNGNGGWVKSLYDAGLWESLIENEIEWINVFSIDNVLQNIADPLFLGATIINDCVASGKVIKKINENESVGTICKYCGHPYVIEYYDLPDSIRQLKDDCSNPIYNYGVTLNYLFKLDVLEWFTKNNMNLHCVKKKVKYTNYDGLEISPDIPNAYKFEYLILDMIKYLGNFLPVEVVRKKEFAPIKNLHGQDSVDTARQLLELNNIPY